MSGYLAYVRKALCAAGFGLAGALGAAMLDGQLTGAECIVSAGTALLAGVATYKAENGPQPPGRHVAE